MGCPRKRLGRLIKKRTDKHMWFKKSPDEDKPPTVGENIINNRSKKREARVKNDLRKTVAVLNIPRTNNGGLVKILRAAETGIRSVCTTKVRIAEKLGTTMRALLTKSNP